LGLKQRLGVAAALLTNPELVILDEPTNGLDPSGMVEMRQLIQHLAAQGMTVILSSHLLHEVQQVCTRVAILKEGAVVAQGAVSELLATGRGIVLGFDQPQRSLQAVQVLQEAATNGASWLRGARYVRPEPGAWTPPGGWLLQVEAPLERAPEVAYLLAARGIYPMEMRQREGSLEELFLALTSTTSPQSASPASPVPAPQSVAQQPGVANQSAAVSAESMTAARPVVVSQPAIPATSAAGQQAAVGSQPAPLHQMASTPQPAPEVRPFFVAPSAPPSMAAAQAPTVPPADVSEQVAPAETGQSLEPVQPLKSLPATPAQEPAPEAAQPPPGEPLEAEPQSEASPTWESAPAVSPTSTIPLHQHGEATSNTPAAGSSGESGGTA
jgi:hypothetical protein